MTLPPVAVAGCGNDFPSCGCVWAWEWLSDAGGRHAYDALSVRRQHRAQATIHHDAVSVLVYETKLVRCHCFDGGVTRRGGCDDAVFYSLIFGCRFALFAVLRRLSRLLLSVCHSNCTCNLTDVGGACRIRRRLH